MIIEEINRHIDPWHLYKRIYNYPYSFILDSSTAIAEKGKYSFLGCDPFLLVKAKGRRIGVVHNGEREEFIGNPFQFLNELLKKFSMPLIQTPSLPLQGGAVGYLSYDLKDFIEKLPHNAKDDLKLHDLLWGLYDVILICDNLHKKGYIVSTGLPEREEKRRNIKAQKRLKAFRRIISIPEALNSYRPARKGVSPDTFISNFTKKGYIKIIEKALHYISTGDIYQINLSQRFSLPVVHHPLNIYERLRSINPTPMGCFLHFGDIQILSNSPERFLRVSGGIIETCPIKGTIRRGRDLREDSLVIKKLKESPKENAEHIMIVDLERNDIGKVCRYGSVKVRDMEMIETYPNLHHMVSRIEGEIKKEVDIIKAIEALFPGGSITGAPKVRAMEIIDELEPTVRGIYTGAIGYIDFMGSADLNISIRTAIISGGTIHYQSGGGIVADSDPEKEYNETLLKAEAFFSALDMDGKLPYQKGVAFY